MVIGNLPEGWVWKTLGEISEPPQYGWTTSASNTGNLRLLRTTDITSGAIDWDTVPYCAEEPDKKEKYLLHDGDIVISRAGSVGFSHLVKNPKPAVFASYLIRFRPLINEKYVAYFLQSPTYWQAISEQKLGIAIPNVNATKLKQINVPIAPLPEQERIVNRIEELFSDLEAGVAALERVRAGLKRYKASVLKAACEGRLLGHGDAVSVPGELPEGWRWVKVGDIGNITGGITKNSKRNALQKKLPYLRVANVYANELALDDVSEIGVEENEIERALLKKGDLLVVEGNGSADQIGRVAIWDGSISPCLHQNHIIKVRFDPPEVAKYVLYWLLSKDGREQITRVASSTSGLYTLSLSKVSSLPIPLPPLDEQRRIVAEVERRLSVVREVESAVEAGLARAARLRQAILRSAFEGRLA